jgi:hypothetical protein
MLLVMWCRLAGLLLSATLALWADVCADLPTAPADPSNIEEGTRSRTFRLSVRDGGPVFRIEIRPITFGWPAGNQLVHSGDIEVSRCEDGKRIQLLPLAAWQPVNFAPTFHARDINFDGYLDFAVLAEFGAKWGSESWWIFDRTTGRFIQNELTNQLRELKGTDHRIYPKEHEISPRYLTEPWGCGSTVDRYRVVNDRLILIHKEAAEPDGERCTVRVSDLSGAVMRVTRVRRFVKGRPVN